MNIGGSISNTDSNQGGNGGVSKSGSATGGDSDGFEKRGGSFPSFPDFPYFDFPFGNGGDAKSGNAGNANGGKVVNIGSSTGVIENEGSSTYHRLSIVIHI